MSDFFDRFIEDLVKGAEASEGFMPGSRAAVQVSRENRGHEEKLASYEERPSYVKTAYAAGARGALASFGVKIAGGLTNALVSRGVGSAAAKGLAKVAPKVGGPVAEGVKNFAIGQVAGRAGNYAADKVAPQNRTAGYVEQLSNVPSLTRIAGLGKFDASDLKNSLPYSLPNAPSLRKKDVNYGRAPGPSEKPRSPQTMTTQTGYTNRTAGYVEQLSNVPSLAFPVVGSMVGRAAGSMMGGDVGRDVGTAAGALGGYAARRGIQNAAEQEKARRQAMAWGNAENPYSMEMPLAGYPVR